MMPGKSYLIWCHTRDWCKQNPKKLAAIITPEGAYTITFEPKTSQLDGEKINWIERDFEGD